MLTYLFVVMAVLVFIMVLGANPATTTRSAPVGLKLDDGHSTKVAFSRDNDVSFWEKGVTPPGLDGGDAIDTTTMHNVAYRTFAPRQLKSLTESQCRAAYDPNVYNNILDNLLNQAGSVTCAFSDGSTLDYYGYLRTFEPDEITEGEQPEASITINPTNFDPTNDVEAGPVLTSVAGT